MSKRKSYDVTLKLRAVEFAKKQSGEAAARRFRVDPKQIREWLKNEDKLVAQKREGGSKSKRLPGAGRKPYDENMEAAVFSWIIAMRSRKLRVSRRTIREKAKELSASSTFRASIGWLRRFMRRHRLSLRRKTTTSQRAPADVIPKLVRFVLYLRALKDCHKFDDNNIFAMDETACWFDMQSDTTVHPTGARSVVLKSTGHEKDHFTVILSAKASGVKLKPFVVFKGKGTRLLKTLKSIPGIVVKFSQNGWMNDSLTIEYLHTIIGSMAFSKRLLVWDAYRCHTSKAVGAEIKKMKLHTAVIPGGCTKYIQAPDVVWNAMFKSHLRRYYDDWLATPSRHEYTKSGNLRPPCRSLLCEWVKSSWAEISVEAIKKSFLSCAITASTDGTDDDKIHCFKPGEDCAEGREILAEEMSKYDGVCEAVPVPFDDKKTEENEALIEVSDEESETDDGSESETDSDDDTIIL